MNSDGKNADALMGGNVSGELIAVRWLEVSQESNTSL
jgi:hypothetical protein